MEYLKSQVNYAASIVALKSFEPIKGADRICVTRIYGNSVIVSVESKIGDVGLFLPVECALSHEFIINNNLYRKAEWGNLDLSKTGFFDENKRIKCISMKKTKSEGFFIPLSSLSYTGIDLSKLQVGVDFNSIVDDNGKTWEICSKYIPRRNKVQGVGNPGKQARKVRLDDLIVDSQLRLHRDTSNLRRNSHVIKPDTVVQVSTKLHGCLIYTTKLTLPDMNKISIGEVVDERMIGLKVLGVDSDGRIVPTKITNVFNNGKVEEWVKVRGVKAGATHNSPFSVFCTPNHKFCVEGQWIEAIDLKDGDIVTCCSHTPKLTPSVKAVVLGKMLGDGSVSHGNQSYSLEFGHKEEHSDYVEFCHKSLGSLTIDAPVICNRAKSGYGSDMVRSRTHSSYALFEYLKDFYPNGTKKTVPERVANDLCPISMAFWYMDDGSLAHNETQEDRLLLATCSFSAEECAILQKGLLKFGINSKLYNTERDYNRIRLNADDADKFFALIAPYVPKSMQYKLPERYRGYDPIGFGTDVYSTKHITYKGRVKSVTTNPKLNNKSYKYDIETETHNFFANGVVVHNSSAVFGNLLTKKPLNWYEKILKRLGVVVKDTQYGLVVTSRTVVKSVGEKAKDGSFHYYKEDIWSNAADKFIKNKLPAGYTIYGEIVGYTPSGGAIQSCKEGPYSYGCAPGESALYVYRVTNTNADGMVLELNRDQRIAFCERYGFTPVPELYYGSAYNFVDQREAVAEDFGETFVKACEESYVRDQDCDLCKNGVPAEGVVVTIDMFDRTDSYKLKSFRFLAKESENLDSGKIDLESAESEEIVESVV